MPDHVMRNRVVLAAAAVMAAGMLAGCPPVPKPPPATIPATVNEDPGLAPVLGNEPVAPGVYLPLGSYTPLSGDALQRALTDRKTILAQTNPESSTAPATAPSPPLPLSLSPPPMAVKYYLHAREKYLDGANAEAMDFLDKALALDPNALTVLKLMGRVCFAAGQLPKGSTYLQRAYAINPDDVEVNYFLGRYWSERKNINRAVSHLLQAADSPERSVSSAQTPLVSFHLARALQQAGYHQAAAAEYEQFLNTIAIPVAGYRYDRELNYLMNEQWAIHLEAAENYVVCGHYQQAIPHYQTALTHDPQDAFMISRLVNALVHAARQSEPRPSGSDRAVIQSQGQSLPHGRGSDRQSPPPSCQLALDLVISTQGSEDSLKLLVWAYKAAGRENDILADLRARISSEQDDRATDILANAQDYLDKKSDAFNTLASYVHKNPDNLDKLQRLLKRVDSPATYLTALELAAQSLHALPDKHDDILKMFLPSAKFAKTPFPTGYCPKEPITEFVYLHGNAFRAIDEDAIAEKLFRHAVIRDTNATFFPARETLVSLLLSQEKFKDADTIIQDAIAKKQGGAKAYQLLVDSEAAQQRFANALKLSQNACQKFPDSNELRLQLAALYRLRGQDTEADKTLIALIDAAPKCEPAYRPLINSLQSQARDRSAPESVRGKANDDAQTYITKLLKAVPTSVFGRVNAALLVAYNGQPMDAEASLRRIAIEHPDDVEVLSLLAQLRQVLGLSREAVSLLEESLRKNPSPDLTASLARLYREQKKTSEALDLTARLMAEHPDDESYVLVHAAELMAQQKSADAITVLSQAIGKFPKSSELPPYLARLQVEFANPADDGGGVATMQNFITRTGETAARLYTLSHLQSAAGQDAQAQATLQRILTLMPDHTGANNDLAYAWTNAHKNLDQAQLMLEKALNNEPNNSAFLDSLGWLYYKQGHFDKAVAILEKAITLPRGTEPDVLQHLADSLYRLGKKAEATARFRQAQNLLQQALASSSLSPEQRKVKTYLDSILSALNNNQEPKLTPTAAE
ncbi:MAG: tetratricopeptide repeat protein [Phycisphaerales bacterium]|nr:tetratricopeptide repeat protein [Phycisphaerales bacterium]